MPKSRGRQHGKKPRRGGATPPRSFEAAAVKMARELLRADTTRLDAESLASALIGAQVIRNRQGPSRNALDDAIGDLITIAEERSSAASAALLAALELLVDDPRIPAALSGWAAEHLGGLTWRTQPPAGLVGARRVPDPYDDHVTWLLEFEDCILAATTARWYAQALLHVFLLDRGPLDKLDDHAEPVDVAQALQVVASGQRHTEMFWPPADDDDYRPLAQLLAARLGRLDIPEEERDWEPMSDERRAELLDEFEADLGFDEDVRDITRLLADTCLDYADGYLDDDPLAWSPDIVERFLLDWVPRKTLLEPEEQRLLPLVTHAFVGWCLVKRGLPRSVAADAAQVALDLQEEFEDAYDEAEPSPATALAAYLRDHDIDTDDEDALEAAIGAFNAERNARILLGED